MIFVGKFLVFWCVLIIGDELWRFFVFKFKDFVICIIVVFCVFFILCIFYDFFCVINFKIMVRYMRERVSVWINLVKWCFMKYRVYIYSYLDLCIV